MRALLAAIADCARYPADASLWGGPVRAATAAAPTPSAAASSTSGTPRVTSSSESSADEAEEEEEVRSQPILRIRLALRFRGMILLD